MSRFASATPLPLSWLEQIDSFYRRLLLIGERPASVVYDAETAVHQDGHEEKNSDFWHLIATQLVGTGGVADAKRDMPHLLCAAVIMDLPRSGLVLARNCVVYEICIGGFNLGTGLAKILSIDHKNVHVSAAHAHGCGFT